MTRNELLEPLPDDVLDHVIDGLNEWESKLNDAIAMLMEYADIETDLALDYLKELSKELY